MYRQGFSGRIFDADNHLYETEDAFTRYLPSQYEGIFKYVQVHGRTKIAVNNVISEYIPNPTFEVVGRPGALADYFGGNNREGRTPREIIGEPMRSIDAFRSAEARLALLDELGLDAALMFPTLASLLEIHFTDDPELTSTLVHSFNEWLHDEWTFDYDGRIFATPIVNPCVVDRAVAELDWLLDRGAKVVLLRPAPVAGTRGTLSPFLPEFDPFWARIGESGLLVALHSSDSGYQRYASEWEGGSRGSDYVQAPALSRVRHSRSRHTRRRCLSGLSRHAVAAFRTSRLPVSRTGAAGRRDAFEPWRGPTRRCPKSSLSIPATSSCETSGSTRSGRTTSRASSLSWAPTTSSSARTTRTPKAWPNLSVGSSRSLTSIRHETWLK